MNKLECHEDCRCQHNGICLSGDAHLAARGRMTGSATACKKCPGAVYRITTHFGKKTWTEVKKLCDEYREKE